MNVIHIILLAACIIESFFLAGIILKTDVIKAAVFGCVFFFSEYVLVSGFLFWMDRYTIALPMVIIVIAQAVGLFFCYRRYGGYVWKKPGNRYVPMLLLLVLILPVIWQKFGYYGMGQDEGVYQSEALAFISGDYSNQKDLPEYELLRAEDQERYHDWIYGKVTGNKGTLTGLYEYLSYSGKQPNTPASGMFHAVPTYPALLALWGSCFGYQNMTQIHTLFYVLMLFMVFFILYALKIKGLPMWGALTVTAFSPLLVWLCKSSLTETFYLCLCLWFVYFMIASYSERNCYIATFALCTLSFYHLTIYIYLPGFLLVYLYQYFKKYSKTCLNAATVLLVFFGLGMAYSTYNATYYSVYLNFEPLYKHISFINENNVLTFWILLVVFLIVAIQAIGRLIPVLNKKKTAAVMKKAETEKKQSKRATLIRNTAIVISGISVILYTLFLLFYSYEGSLETFANMHSFPSYFYMTGFSAFIFIILVAIIKPSLIGNDRKSLILYMFLFYVVAIKSVFQKDVSYYYYARYIVPFIPLIPITAVAIMNNMKRKFVKNAFAVVITAVALAFMLPYTLVWKDSQDDTNIEWEKLQNICENLSEENTVVVMDQTEAIKVFYFPLRYIAKVEPLVYLGDDREGCIQSLLAQGKNVYFLRIWTDRDYGEPVLEDYFMSSESNGALVKEFLKIPKEVVQKENQIFVFQCTE